MPRNDTWVLPYICPECDAPLTGVLFLIVCARCRTAKLDYEFISDWRQRINADTLAVWELEGSR